MYQPELNNIVSYINCCIYCTVVLTFLATHDCTVPLRYNGEGFFPVLLLMPFFDRVRALDSFAKTHDDYRTKTAFGGIGTMEKLMIIGLID